jgi:hypothetical protein
MPRGPPSAIIRAPTSFDLILLPRGTSHRSGIKVRVAIAQSAITLGGTTASRIWPDPCFLSSRRGGPLLASTPERPLLSLPHHPANLWVSIPRGVRQRHQTTGPPPSKVAFLLEPGVLPPLPVPVRQKAPQSQVAVELSPEPAPRVVSDGEAPREPRRPGLNAPRTPHAPCLGPGPGYDKFGGKQRQASTGHKINRPQ